MVSRLGLKMTIDGEAAPLGVLRATRSPAPTQRPSRPPRTPSSRSLVNGTGAVDVRGNLSDVTYDTRSISDPNLKGTLDSLSAQLGSVSAPFPTAAAPVRWSVGR